MPCTASVCKSTPRSRAELADLRDGLDRADLVVGEHHDTRMVLSVMAFFTSSGSTRPSLVDVEVGDLEALFSRRLQVSSTALCSITVVMMWLPFSRRTRHALEREVVALGGAGGEDDLLRVLRADEERDLLAGDASTASSAVQPKAWLRLAALPNFS
jgi:hypothetical protein